MTKPAGAQQSHAQVNGKASGAHHHYEFNPADIVAEDALGYTVRHGDHFHYILKSSLPSTMCKHKQKRLPIVCHRPQDLFLPLPPRGFQDYISRHRMALSLMVKVLLGLLKTVSLLIMIPLAPYFFC